MKIIATLLLVIVFVGGLSWIAYEVVELGQSFEAEAEASMNY